MNNGKGKCKSNPHSDDEEEAKKIDLTLKLGPSSTHYYQNQEEGGHGSFSSQSSNVMGNWNVGVASYSTSGSSTNYMPLMYPCFIPSHNSNAANTTPTRKRPISDDTKACKACGSNTTPLWRKGPDGPQTLCNACGLRHLRTVKRNGGDK